METTPTETAQIVDLLREGLSQRVVARWLHISQSCVSKAYKRFRETGRLILRPRSGRHRYTSERDDRFIVSTSL
ncbi:helix-turn-helix domain-containing protein [Pseudomonas aeruginosa]|nr:helix-turn-helix domain-containing protein [Pseudomonas aeruginosa]